MRQYVHFYGNTAYFEKENGDMLQFSAEQFQLLRLISKNFNNEQIIAELLKDQWISEEQRVLINKNINAFRDLCIHNNVDLEDWKETGVQGKYYPKALTIEMTNKCNFCCSHCYKDADVKNKQFLPQKVLESIYSDFPGRIAALNLTGGEPLLYPNVSNHIELLGENFHVNITTNGSLLKQLSEKALNVVNNFQISIYGYDEASYERYTGKKGQFQHVIDSMKLLTKKGKSFTVGICINKTVCNYIEKYIKMLEGFSVTNITFTPIGKVGRGARTEEWNVGDEDIQRIVSYMENNSVISSNSAYLGMEGQKESDNEEEFCSAGACELSISEKGELLYCNVLDHDFFEIGDFDKIYEIVETGNAPHDFKEKMRQYIACHDCHSHVCPVLEEAAK